MFKRKVSSSEIVAKKQTRVAKRAVVKAIKLSIEDQNSMLKRARHILRAN